MTESTIKKAVTAFPALYAAVLAEDERQKADALYYIQNGFLPTWAAEHRTDPDRGLREYLTPARLESYEAGRLDRDKAVQIAYNRRCKDIDKTTAAQLGKLERAALAPDLAYMSISVEWVRSQTWGYNPHARACAPDGIYEGRASGYGYDKRSAAVAAALNQSPAVMGVLYRLADNAIRAHGLQRYQDNPSCVNWRDSIGYGAGYSILPAFEGGVGVSCFWKILRVAGHTIREDESRAHYDYYTISKEGR